MSQISVVQFHPICQKALRKPGAAAFTFTLVSFLSTADCVISEKEGFVPSRLTDAFSSLG